MSSPCGGPGEEHNASVAPLGREQHWTDGCEHMAAALERNSTLEILHLNGNNVRDEGCRYLAAALERNNALRSLYLFQNNIGADGYRYLAVALERNNALRSLFLSWNNIGMMVVVTLRRPWRGTARSRHSTCTRTTSGLTVLLLFRPCCSPTTPIRSPVWMESSPS
jgi:hypothetical protein